MNLSCTPKKPTPTPQARVVQATNRDIGLSNIFNVNTSVTPCIEDYTSPTYTMSGACAVTTTGLTITSDCIHNLSDIDSFDITFDFTGSTQYTGYTGEFCYTLIGELNTPLFNQRCISYGDITGSSWTNTITKYDDLRFIDNEYRIRTWDKFKTKECIVTGETIDRIIIGGSNPSTLTIDTSNYGPIDLDKDWYISTIKNPTKPNLDFIPQNALENLVFRNEQLTSTINGASQFTLNHNPVGGVVVLSVNGITVNSNDYTIDGTLVTMNGGITMESTDVITAYYNSSSVSAGDLLLLEERAQLEMFSVTGIVTGVTATTTNIVNYNPDSNRLEVFLQQDIDPATSPTVTINGIDIVYEVDVFKSNVVDNKLVFNTGVPIQVGDIISIYYYYTGVNNPGDLGKLRIDTPEISWTAPINELPTLSPTQVFQQSNGIFVVEITDKLDTGYTSIIKSGTTNYNNNTSGYNLVVGPITSTSVDDYIYRIRFIKNYSTSIIPNTYTTESISDNGSFRLDWDYISNTIY
jgi:hypothetical protein